jgi:CCR4-NOT complex subunit CAF16
MADQVDTSIAPSIGVKDLSYAFPDGSSGLKEVFLDLPPGSRTLLIGGIQFPSPLTTPLGLHTDVL